MINTTNNIAAKDMIIITCVEQLLSTLKSLNAVTGVRVVVEDPESVNRASNVIIVIVSQKQRNSYCKIGVDKRR